MKYVSKKEDFNQKKHFAVIIFSFIYIPGDDRSRTCPGHGCPEENKSIVEYLSFTSKDELEKWILKGESCDYQVIESIPLTIQKKVSLIF